jgi:6-phosphogluconolactonase (cycloisomerase 2 family)
MHGARSLTVSPDGRNVYSTATAADSISVFARDTTTGALRQLGCVEDTLAQKPGTCSQTARGLNYPRQIAISPDGRNAYVASDIADSTWAGDPADGSDVAVFSRDPSDGRLTQLPGDAGCIKDRQAPGTNRCTAVGNGLKGAFGATVSPDGRNVYVAADDHGTIASFSRDPGTGALTQLPGAASCMKDAVRGDGSCPTRAMGIAGANLVTLSADGAYAYVAGFDALAVASFARDRSTGALTPLGCVEDVRAGPRAHCGAKGPGIFNPRVVVLSPDGRFGYVPASAGNAIAIFSTGTSTQRR